MEIEFKNKKFFITKGSTHPEYSIFTFTDEEADFRNKYWDIKSGELVIDVGTSYGAYSLTACALGATVFCFEPEKTVFDDLVKNIKLNNWEQKCFPSNLALYSSPTTVNMKEYAPHWPSQSITSLYSANTLDNVISIKEIKKIDWLKIDVEGVEEHVLMGGQQAITKFKPNIIVECHNFMDAGISNRVKKILLSFADYKIEEVKRDPCIILVAKVKKD